MIKIKINRDHDNHDQNLSYCYNPCTIIFDKVYIQYWDGRHWDWDLDQTHTLLQPEHDEWILQMRRYNSNMSCSITKRKVTRSSHGFILQVFRSACVTVVCLNTQFIALLKL